MMWNEEDSDEDEQQSGEVTEKNPNYEKKEKCNCRQGCSKRSCSCFKFGSGCNPSCGCASSCENMFNHLEYFFGRDEERFDESTLDCIRDWARRMFAFK